MIKFDESFNWLAVLKDLADGMPLITEDYLELLHLAAGWPTCACGQLCSVLPKNSCGAPLDSVAKWLGLRFVGHVGQREWRDAISCFRQIEARTEELIDATDTTNIPS